MNSLKNWSFWNWAPNFILTNSSLPFSQALLQNFLINFISHSITVTPPQHFIRKSANNNTKLLNFPICNCLSDVFLENFNSCNKVVGNYFAQATHYRCSLWLWVVWNAHMSSVSIKEFQRKPRNHTSSFHLSPQKQKSPL